jgi:hypothetical protein
MGAEFQLVVLHPYQLLHNQLPLTGEVLTGCGSRIS